MDWQPISTAPKDKQLILYGTVSRWGGYIKPKEMVIGHWNTDRWVKNSWVESVRDPIFPTHWQLAPEEPEEL